MRTCDVGSHDDRPVTGAAVLAHELVDGVLRVGGIGDAHQFDATS